MSRKKAPSTKEAAAPPAEEKQKRSVRSVLNIIINVILIVAIILAAVCTYVSFVATSGNGVPSLLGYEFFSVQTDSMYPTLKAGDFVVATAVRDPSELRVGDIITYWTIINGERALNTHRINQIYDGGGYLIFETKGDNNDIADSLTVHESEVVGKYSSRIGGLGKVLDYLQTSTGFLLVVVIPVALFFIYHLIQFFRVLFEYQSVKNRLQFEEERARQEQITAAAIEAAVASQTQAQAPPAPEKDQADLKAELREQLKAEMMAEMMAEMKKQAAAEAMATAPKEEPAPEPKADPEPEAAPEIEAAPEPEAVPETETTPEPEASPETETAPEPEASPETEAAPEPEATPETGAAPEAEADADSAGQEA